MNGSAIVGSQVFGHEDALTGGAASPDRVYYSTGSMLDAEDFTDEQTYHRRQLARALTFTCGYGTAAGLKVRWVTPSGSAEEMVTVDPGLAVDRVGRIVEVPRLACIRLDRWYDQQAADTLELSLNTGSYAAVMHTENSDGTYAEPPVPLDGVVADLFLRYVACERGKTPAFATGPFDALDAVQPSRLRDWYELKLFPRERRDQEDPHNPGVSIPARPVLPETPWNGSKATLHKRVFETWDRVTMREDIADGSGLFPLKALAEHEGLTGIDTTSVFLARIVIPATSGGAGNAPVRASGPVLVENHIRPFIYSAAALAGLV
jgi:hypothetical protein